MVRGQNWENDNKLAKLEEGVRKEQRSNFLEIGKLLTEILDNELYVLKGYKSFVKYIDDEPVFRFTGKHAIRLVRTYRFIESLPPGVSVPTSERQVCERGRANAVQGGECGPGGASRDAR